jgi:hypothetical protein
MVHLEWRHTIHFHANNTEVCGRNICCVVGGASLLCAEQEKAEMEHNNTIGRAQSTARLMSDDFNGSPAHWQLANRASSLANPPCRTRPLGSNLPRQQLGSAMIASTEEAADKRFHRSRLVLAADAASSAPATSPRSLDGQFHLDFWQFWCYDWLQRQGPHALQAAA